MTWLYHVIPSNMSGATLYPLSELKEQAPDRYQSEIKKYKSRKEILEQTVPLLEVQWDEVIHLSPVPPTQIKEAANLNETIEAYKIHHEELNQDKAALWEYTDRNPGISKQHVHWLQNIDLDDYQELPSKTKEYYKQCQKHGRNPLLFVHIPHVFYKDTIDVEDADIIEL
jgi:hypothetical protein